MDSPVTGELRVKARGAGLAMVVGALATVAGLLTIVLLAGASGGSVAGAAGPAVRYVALGDSFTAGPAIPQQLAGEIPAGCKQSSQNFPHLIAQSTRAVGFSDLSCSGATTRNLFERQVTGSGTNEPQLDAVTEATNFVSVGIGGNDIGFMSAISTCAAEYAAGRSCRARFAPGGDDLISKRVADTRPKIVEVLGAILLKAPHAEILVIGYPTPFPVDGSSCPSRVPLSSDDITFLNANIRRMNAMLAGEAARAHAGFVDNYSYFAGHDACKAPNVRWVEPSRPVNPALAAHPNASGERAMATRALQQITNR